MIYEVNVAGKLNRVELKKSGEHWSCKLDGVDLLLDAISTREGVLSILIAGKSYEVKQEGTASESNIVVGGVRVPVLARNVGGLGREWRARP